MSEEVRFIPAGRGFELNVPVGEQINKKKN